MTNSREFLLKELREIFLTIENIEISYEYRSTSQNHIIEVKPKKIFHDSKKYVELELDLEKRFLALFPNEELMFISEDSLTKINLPDLIYNIKIDYKKLPNLISPPISSNFENNTSYSLAA